jgi:ATP-binding cassette subfamily B protein
MPNAPRTERMIRLSPSANTLTPGCSLGQSGMSSVAPFAIIDCTGSNILETELPSDLARDFRVRPRSSSHHGPFAEFHIAYGFWQYPLSHIALFIGTWMKSEWRAIIDAVRTILSNFWKQSRGTIAVVVLISFVSSVALVATPYIFSRLIDRLTSGAETSVVGFVLYALLLGVAVALSDTVAYLSLMCAKNLDFVIATNFFEKVLKKTVGFFIDNNPAEIQNARENGEEALKDIVELVLVVFIPDITQIVLSLIVIGTIIDLKVMAIVVVYGTLFIALTCFANARTRAYLETAMDASQENAKFVGNAMNAMEILRHFGSDRWMSERFADKAREVRDSWRSFSVGRMGYTALFGAALFVEFAITAVILLPRYKAGNLSIGDLVLFNAVLLQLNNPFEMIGRAINQVVQAYTQFQPFVRVWSAPEEKERAAFGSFSLKKGRIEFEEVSFSYEGGLGVERVTFVAERGRITYLTGETGAGKSTVLKLALKSLEPNSGRIRVDGTDLNDISRADWYTMVGIVPQEVLLINDTLRSNIVLGRPLDETRLRKAVEKAAILEFIEALPEGFETTVGERGLKLSGGERQRIAIARALYAEPGILFLDEASSALDEATESDIMAHIRVIAHEVTILAITHRERIIAPGDRIVRIRDGKVVAGTQQLLA